MTLVDITCLCCSIIVKKNIKHVNAAKKNGHQLFCSKNCSSLYKAKEHKLKCNACNKLVIKKNSQVLKSQSGNVYCSRSCSNTINNSVYKSQENHPNYKDGIGYYRKLALEHYGAACTICGYDTEQVLQVHHRDSNRRNNIIENLDVLCPTHHSEFTFNIRAYH